MLWKRITVILASVAACVMLVSCGEVKDISMDINELAGDLKEEITYQDTLESIEPDMIKMLYDVNDLVESSVVYMGSGATAEEIAVFECKDMDTAKNEVEPIVKQHIQDQITSFESYVPAEVAKLKEAVVRPEFQPQGFSFCKISWNYRRTAIRPAITPKTLPASTSAG